MAEGVLAEGLVLQPEPIGRADLLKAGGEVAVPEEGHLFLQRAAAEGHAAQPPVTELGHLGVLGAVALLAEFLFPFRVLGTAQGLVEHGQLGVGLGRGPVGRGGVVGDAVVIDQPGDGAVETHFVEVLDLGGAPAKPRPVKEMGSGLLVPLAGMKGLEHGI